MRQERYIQIDLKTDLICIIENFSCFAIIYKNRCKENREFDTEMLSLKGERGYGEV